MKARHPVVHGKVRLTLTINGQAYTVIPQGLDNECPSYVLKKVDGTRYIVKLANSGISCSCPDFTKRKRADGACKHIKSLQKFYMLGGANG
jgi:hypothetical protein